MKERPVVVRWRDAYATDATAWVSAYDAPDEEVIIATVGFLVPDHQEGYVVIADSFHAHCDVPYYAGLNYIPRAMVVDTIIL